MKKIILVLSIFASFSLFSFKPLTNGYTHDGANKIKWMTVQEALAKYQENPKKIIVDIYTEWCTTCKKMEASTFEHPIIANYINDNFYPVKIDAEMKEAVSFAGKTYQFNPNEGRNGVHELVIYLTRGKLSYPSVVFLLNEKMNNPQSVVGFQNPIRMDKILKYFGENYYQQLDWGVFSQVYQSEISAGESRTSSSTQGEIGKAHDGSRNSKE